MFKRILALCASLSVSLCAIPLQSFADDSADPSSESSIDTNVLSLPEKLSAPTNLVLTDLRTHPYYISSDSQIYLNFANTEEANVLYNHFQDADWDEENEDNFVSAYGVGYHLDYTGVQVDYRVDDGDWHYDSNWDENPYGDFDTYSDGIDTDYNEFNHITSSKNILNSSYCSEENTLEYQLKDIFEDYTDGSDTYYTMDTKNHSLSVRARYFFKIQYSDYYGAPEGTDEYIYIYSDFSEPTTYGKDNTYHPTFSENYVLPTPELNDFKITEQYGYLSAPNISFHQNLLPEVLPYVYNIDNYANSLYLYLSISFDGGETWQSRDIEYFGFNPDFDLGDFWSDLYDSEYQPNDSILIKSYYKGTTDNGDAQTEVFSKESEPIEFILPNTEYININIEHQGDFYAGKGSESFRYTVGSEPITQWIAGSIKEGGYIQKVLINDQVYYDIEDESTYELLGWEHYDERTDDYDFQLPDALSMPTEDMTITFVYNGTALDRCNLTFTVNGVKTDTDAYDMIKLTDPESVEVGEHIWSKDWDSVNVETADGYTLTIPLKHISNPQIYKLDSIVIDGKEYSQENVDIGEYFETTLNLSTDTEVILNYSQAGNMVYVTVEGDCQGMGDAHYEVYPGSILGLFWEPVTYDNGETSELLDIIFEYYDEETDSYITESYSDIEGVIANANEYRSFSMNGFEISDQKLTIKFVFSSESIDEDPTETVNITWINAETNEVVYTETNIVVKGNYAGFDLMPSGVTSTEIPYVIESVSVNGEIIEKFGGTRLELTEILETKNVVVTLSVIKQKLGDINNDGQIDSDDAVLCLKQANADMMGEAFLDDSLIPFADVNADGFVDSDDCALILKHSVAEMLGDTLPF